MRRRIKNITMKKSILLIAALFVMGLNSIAQNNYNLIIFSEDGDPFFAFVNGIRQNDKPETNIKVTGLNSEALNVRVEFENKALPKLKQNMMPEFGFEHTVNIVKNMKKEMKMRYFGKVPLGEAPKSSASAVAYHTSENPVTTSGNSSEFNTSDGSTNTSVTTTTTTTKVNSNPGDVSINVNMGGAGMNVNINGMENGQGSMNSSSSTTVTTKSSTSSSSTGGGAAAVKNPSPKSEPVAQPVSTSGCRGAMPGANYDKMKKAIDDKPFSDTKMSTAKVATKNSCLSVEQIKGICGLFSMDDDKLTYAKFAYNYCTDKANYYQVSEIFSFSGTTDSLNKFLEEN